MADAESPFFTKEPNPLDTQVGGGHYKKWKIQPLEFVELNGLSWFGLIWNRSRTRVHICMFVYMCICAKIGANIRVCAC